MAACQFLFLFELLDQLIEGEVRVTHLSYDVYNYALVSNVMAVRCSEFDLNGRR